MLATSRNLKSRIARLACTEGTSTTGVDGLSVIRITAPTEPFAVEYRPCICMVGQGRKKLTVGEQELEYDPDQYLVVSLPVPVTARIVEASPERPFLATVLSIDVAEVHRLLLDLPAHDETSEHAAMHVSSMDPRLTDAVVRLLDAASDPTEAKVLAPGIVREILYRILEGEQGDMLRLLAHRDGHAQRVARVIQFVQEHFHEPLDIATIAKSAGISGSRLQHVFKDVTALSPMQYVKQVRLHRARVMMVTEGLSAGEAAHRVGYGSASQFSREFKRQFGLTPSRAAREAHA